MGSEKLNTGGQYKGTPGVDDSTPGPLVVEAIWPEEGYSEGVIDRDAGVVPPVSNTRLATRCALALAAFVVISATVKEAIDTAKIGNTSGIDTISNAVKNASMKTQGTVFFDKTSNSTYTFEQNKTYHLPQINHDGKTIVVDGKYGKSLIYRFEDVDDSTNIAVVTTVISDASKPFRFSTRLKNPTKKGVKFSVRLAEDPQQKPKGLIADGVLPLPQSSIAP